LAADGYSTIIFVASWTPCCWPRFGSSFYITISLSYSN